MIICQEQEVLRLRSLLLPFAIFFLFVTPHDKDKSHETLDKMDYDNIEDIATFANGLKKNIIKKDDKSSSSEICKHHRIGQCRHIFSGKMEAEGKSSCKWSNP